MYNCMFFLQASKPVYAWWGTPVDVICVACDDGSLWFFKHKGDQLAHVTVSEKPYWSCNGQEINKDCVEPGDTKRVTPIRKFQYISPGGPWMVYVGGCTNMPADSSDSNILSVCSKFKKCKPLVPFGAKIVDVMRLPCEQISIVSYM